MKKNKVLGVLAAAAVLACPVVGVSQGTFFSAMPAAQAAELTAKGGAETDWTKGADSVITAVGYGLPPEGETGTRGRILARRAALVDAYRYLAEEIQGVQVDADTTMENLMLTKDTVRTQTNALIKGAKIVSEQTLGDGAVTVKVQVPLYGVQNSLAAIAVPEVRGSGAAVPVPAVSSSVLPETEQKEIAAADYTGIIVDCSGMGLDATFAPAILDESGRTVYGIANLDYDFAIKEGMVEYSTSLAAAKETARAGARPLIVKAQKVSGGKNSANPVNAVVSNEDGERILAALQTGSILRHAAVVFVK